MILIVIKKHGTFDLYRFLINSKNGNPKTGTINRSHFLQYSKTIRKKSLTMIGIIRIAQCDIPEELLQQYGINRCSTIVRLGDEQFRDRVDMTPDEFYQKLVGNPIHPHSSMPSTQDFEEAFDKSHCQRGYRTHHLDHQQCHEWHLRNRQKSDCILKIRAEVVDSKAQHEPWVAGSGCCPRPRSRRRFQHILNQYKNK